jgi:hypothetical protein
MGFRKKEVVQRNALIQKHLLAGLSSWRKVAGFSICEVKQGGPQMVIWMCTYGWVLLLR